ncbi:MAG: efflux RND transporter periplasmic adaptor subunit [Planctomycetes bacterium]|nr:efflux RND transporter periplasmic adaptor subunit [Planctomycetota bacterium]
MKTLLRALLPLLVVAGAAGILRWQLASRPALPVQERKAAVALVQVLPIQARDHQLVVYAQGTVEALDPLPLAPEVGGRVVEVSPQLVDGAFCAEGDLLLRLDPADFELSLAAAEARVGQARAALALEQAAADLSIQDWTALVEGEPNALVRREPQLAAARADLAAAEAARDRARRDLDRCQVTAPFDARVEGRRVSLGQVLAPGTVVASLLPTAAAEVILPLALEDLDHLGIDLACWKVDLPVTLEARIGGALVQRQARLIRSLPTLDPASRMLRTVARIADPFGLDGQRTPIGPGLFVQASIQGEIARGVFVLPRSAILSGDRVHLADDEDRLRTRQVVVLQRGRDEVLIHGGLADGDRVVLTTVPVAAEGMMLEIREGNR